MSFKILVVGALFVASACTNSEPVSPLAGNRAVDRALLQGVPGDGNKIVTPIELDLPGFTTCAGGAKLDLHIVGWIQDRPGGGEPPHQPGVVTFYFDFTFSNAQGETYVWHQVGSERFYLDGNGNFVFSLTGRTLDNVGRMVINITTGELVEFVAGRSAFGEDLACARLT